MLLGFFFLPKINPWLIVLEIGTLANLPRRSSPNSRDVTLLLKTSYILFIHNFGTL